MKKDFKLSMSKYSSTSRIRSPAKTTNQRGGDVMSEAGLIATAFAFPVIMFVLIGYGWIVSMIKSH